MNYLIIDDEPIAHTLIETFAKDIPSIHLIGHCYTAMEAIPFLQSEKIDLIFLDIQMPKLHGFDFLKTLHTPPQIIIISAHAEYALEGYEYNITDYLLKPFNFERFFKSVQKASQNLNTPSEQSPTQTLFIKDEKAQHKVNLSDIRYVEANGNYAMVHLTASRILTQMKMADLERLLPVPRFIRIHRSYIINTDFISLVKATEIHFESKVFPVGRVYKENIRTLLY